MKRIITLILLANTIFCFAQLESNQRAKLYFQEAQKQFNQNEYDEALLYIEKTENVLGATNGRILNLKIKTLYNKGSFLDAEEALNTFIDYHSENVTDELKEETLAYFVRIENAAKANKQKNQQDRINRINFFNSNRRKNPESLPLPYEQDGKFGLIGREGEIISPFKWKYAKSIFENKMEKPLYFVQSMDNLFGVYDADKKQWLFKVDGDFSPKNGSYHNVTHWMRTMKNINEDYKNSPIVFKVTPKHDVYKEKAKATIYNINGKKLFYGFCSCSLNNHVINYYLPKTNKVSRGSGGSSNFDAANNAILIDLEGNTLFSKFSGVEILKGTNLLALNIYNYNYDGSYQSETGYVLDEYGNSIIGPVLGYRYAKMEGNYIAIYVYEKPEKRRKENVLKFDLEGNKLE